MENSPQSLELKLENKNLNHHLTRFINFRDWINLVATNYVCDLVINIDFLMLGPFQIKWVAAAYLMFMQL
jgi:hypothetical protein